MTHYPNQPEKTAELESASCVTQPDAGPESAYDSFMSEFGDLIRLAGGASDPLIVRLCLLGLTSITEEYFRAVFSGITRICPKIAKHASKESISVAASLYYPKDGIGYALLEHVSLSDAECIRKHTQRLCELRIPDSSSLSEALNEFDKVCHLRHAVIHSNGRLSAQNAAQIGVSGVGPWSIALTLTSLQGIAEICLNTVRAFNRFLWEKVIERWIKEKIITGDINEDLPLIRSLTALLCENGQTIFQDDALMNDLYVSEVAVRLKQPEGD